MLKKILPLLFIFTSVPCFAASNALDQLKTNIDSSIPAEPTDLLPAAVPAELSGSGSPSEPDTYFRAIQFTQPILPGKTYEAAVAEFKAYRESKRNGIKNDDNLPFFLDHGARTKNTVLMIHGLTDSPWYMRALGEKLYKQGYNVICILLPGHGTRPEDLLHVKLLQWQQEVDLGLGLAAGLGDKISLAGFSTGGALALDALRRHPELKAEKIFLFSPAIALNEAQLTKIELGCQAPWLTTHILGEYRESHPETIVEDNPYYYNKMAINGICQLYYLTRDLKRGQDEILRSIGSGAAVFAAQSGADKLVNPDAVTKFMSSLPGTSNIYVWYPAEDGVEHIMVPRPENNPYFPELLRKLEDFTR